MVDKKKNLNLVKKWAEKAASNATFAAGSCGSDVSDEDKMEYEYAIINIRDCLQNAIEYLDEVIE